MRTQMKASLAALALFAMAATTPALAAEDYYGGWSLTRDKTSGKVQHVTLGDRTKGTGLLLRNSYRFCHRPGSAERVAEALERENPRVYWLVTDTCDKGEYIRVCIVSSYVEEACATFQKLGWKPFKNR